MLGLLICTSVSGLALSVLASHSFRADKPELAIKLNPLDPQARINFASEQLFAPEEPTAYGFMSTKQAIGYNRSDARLRSMLGLLELRVGAVESAYVHFETARRILPTEIQALTQLIRRDFDNKDFDSVAEQLDMLARRWRGQWPAVEPYAKELARSERGLKSLKKQFQVPRAERAILLNTLLAAPIQLQEAQSLVEDWVLKGLDQNYRLSQSLLVAKLKQRQFSSAFSFHQRFFRKSSQDLGENGNLIYNSTFKFPFDGTPFDWRVFPTKGVYQNTDTDSGLITQFLNSPVRLSSPKQSIEIKSGNYKLSVNYSAVSLEAPGAIELSIKCNNRVLSAIPINTGNQEKMTGSVTFDVSDSECELYDIELNTEKLPESRQYRLSGKIILHQVDLKRI